MENLVGNLVISPQELQNLFIVLNDLFWTMEHQFQSLFFFLEKKVDSMY